MGFLRLFLGKKRQVGLNDTIPVQMLASATPQFLTVKGVVLDNKTLHLISGEKAQLTPTIYISPIPSNVTWSSNRTDIATVDGNGLVTAVSAGAATITITVVEGTSTYTATCSVTVGEPPVFVWSGSTDSDWNEDSNWEDGKAPKNTDLVFIPGPDKIVNFPQLKQKTEVAKIHFAPGAQLGGQKHLQAGKAFVQYDFSNISRRDRGLMLSIPLGQAFSADFTFGGYPLTWLRTFSYRDEGGMVKGNWETAQKSDEPLSYGSGFVLFIEKNGLSNPAKGLNYLNNILELPYFENTDNEKINHAHEFKSGVGEGLGTSEFHYFQIQESESVIRDDLNPPYPVTRNSTAYQLAGESNIELNTDFHIGGKFALIGNPYMAALNFEKFYLENQDLIKDNYRIWTDGVSAPDYRIYSYVLGEDNVELSKYIAPLQGFIVEKKENATTGQLIATEDMAEVMHTAVLRSSVNQKNILNIVAGNKIAENRTFIAEREGGQAGFGDMDARRIINDISDAPKIYTLKPYKNSMVAAAFSIINNENLLIPLGLATSYTGNITLTFSGMDSYDANLTLIDALTKQEFNLTGLASYDYTFNYTPKKLNGEAAVCEDRFFIRISKTVTDIPKTLVAKVNVFESNGLIQVVSGASNPIREVAVYDLQGLMIYKANAVNAISHTVALNPPAGAYIVKVISEKTIDNVRVVKR